MTQEWIDVQVQSSLDAGELAGLLNDPWMVGSWQEDGLIHLYYSLEDRLLARAIVRTYD